MCLTSHGISISRCFKEALELMSKGACADVDTDVDKCMCMSPAISREMSVWSGVYGMEWTGRGWQVSYVYITAC